MECAMDLFELLHSADGPRTFRLEWLFIALPSKVLLYNYQLIYSVIIDYNNDKASQREGIALFYLQ